MATSKGIWRGGLLGSLLATVACNSTDAKPASANATDTSDAGAESPATSVAVTADWLDHRLSLFDFDALVAGATSRDSVLSGEVDLSRYEQGPLELRILPGGKTALVSVSPGFFTVPGSNILV